MYGHIARIMSKPGEREALLAILLKAPARWLDASAM